MRNENGLCQATIGSMTYAVRAVELLSRAAIRARTVKLSSGQRNGCIYGIELPCSQLENASAVLSRGGLRLRINTSE